MSTPQEIHATLASHGIRLFAIRIRQNGKRETDFFIHPKRNKEQFRADIKEFYKNMKPRHDHTEGWADDKVFNDFYDHMREKGYVEVEDIVADVFECRIAVERATLVDDPDHEEQSDGFGHFGWESKKNNVL